MKKVSVVIPVYNGERYLKRCLDSVLNQSGMNLGFLEIILINDGSKDNSLSIMKEYERRHPSSIKVIDQKNVGVAKTRNKGIDLANGKWLVFVDQDDWIDKDYLITFYEEAERGDYDVVLGGMRRSDGSKTREQRRLKKDKFSKYLMMPMWAKMHKLSFIRQAGILAFPTGLGEDLPFSLKEYYKSNNIQIIDYIGYNWFLNNDSVSNTTQRNLNDHFENLKILIEEIRQYDDESVEFEYFMLRTIMFYLLWGGRTVQSTQFINYYKDLFEWLEDHYPDFRHNKYIMLGPPGDIISSRMSISIFMILDRLDLVRLFAWAYCKQRVIK